VIFGIIFSPLLIKLANYDLLLRYFPAMLSANAGNIIKTFTAKSFISISVRGESGVSGPEAVNTINIPKIPKETEA